MHDSIAAGKFLQQRGRWEHYLEEVSNILFPQERRGRR